MWALRILSGKQAGQIVVLKEGKNIVGRSDKADIQILEHGVSKDHVEITVLEEKVLLADLNSANGLFLNGVRTRGSVIRVGDKLGVGTVLCDIIPSRPKAQLAAPEKKRPPSQRKASSARAPAVAIPAAPRLPSVPLAPRAQVPAAPVFTKNDYVAVPDSAAANPLGIDIRSTQEKIDDYVNGNFLPPLLHATEVFEFRMVLMILIGLYVVAVTALSVIPMHQITSDAIANESRRRATTVGRTVARNNEKVLRSGDIGNFSVESALREEGVEDAYVLSKDGHILAPAERVGLVPKQAGLIHDAIQKVGPHEISDTSDGKVVVGVPILGYDADLQQNVARAYTVIIYNPGSLSFDDGRVFSLFVQTLTLALLVGAIMYFLIYRMIQYPFVQLNSELDKAIRENRDQAQVKVQLPVLRALITNINSLLARVQQGHSPGSLTTGDGVRDHEYMNLVALIGYPAVAISSSGVILKVNSNFEALVGVSAMNLETRPVQSISDQSLQGSINYLMEQAKAMSAQVAVHTLEFSGHPFVMNCQALSKSNGEVDCYLISIKPPESAEGQAA
jgi:hypothetical protein